MHGPKKRLSRAPGPVAVFVLGSFSPELMIDSQQANMLFQLWPQAMTTDFEACLSRTARSMCAVELLFRLR